MAVLGRTKAGKCKACVRARNKKMYSGEPPYGERTHCPQGHPYSGENLRIVKTKTGIGRRCRTCDNERQRAWNAKKTKAA